MTDPQAIPADLMAALRHPSEAEKEAERRLYFVLRRDFPISAGSLARLAAQVTWRTLVAALEQDAPRYLGYDESAQPKIALRARDLKQMERAIAETRALPQGIVNGPDGSPLLLGFGPVSREEMPPFIRKLQVLACDAPSEPAAIELVPQGFAGATLWLIVRADAGIPYGKLAAQAGHGAFGVLAGLARSTPWHISEWMADGYRVATKLVPDLASLADVHAAARQDDLPASFIIDAGRTVFAEPTPTVVGIGPCTAAHLPRSVLHLPDLA